MAFSWRLLVDDLTGSRLATLDVNEPVSTIKQWRVEGNGNCLELALDAKVIGLSQAILPRYVVTLETTTDGLTWTPQFKGFCIKSGAKRNNTRLSEINLLGLKERFKEVVIDDYVIAGGDVAAMARDILSQAKYLPVGVTYDAALVPDVSFVLSDRYPNLETVYDLLEALAATVTGAVWGVNAEGDVFFKVSPTSTQILSEGDGVFVVWDVPDGLDTVDKVRLVLADKAYPDAMRQSYSVSDAGFGTPPNVFSPFPIAHAYDAANDYEAEKLELIPWSDAWLNTVTTTLSAAGWTNPTNANDGDTATYASVSTSSGLMSGDIDNDTRGGYIKYSTTNDAKITLYVYYSAYDGGTLLGSQLSILELVGTEGNTLTQEFVVPVGAWFLENHTIDDATIALFAVANTGEARVYEIVLYELDTATLDTVAQAYVKSPADDVGDITVIGALLTPTTGVDLTLEDATNFDVPTELFTYSITKDGLKTQIRIGQKLESDDQAINKLEQDLRQQTVNRTVKARR